MQNYAKLCKKENLLPRFIIGSNDNQEKLSEMQKHADLGKTMQNYAKRTTCCRDTMTGSNDNQDKLTDMQIQYANLCKTMLNYAKTTTCARDPLQDLKKIKRNFLICKNMQISAKLCKIMQKEEFAAEIHYRIQ